MKTRVEMTLETTCGVTTYTAESIPYGDEVTLACGVSAWLSCFVLFEEADELGLEGEFEKGTDSL